MAAIDQLVEHRYVKTRSLRLHVATAGPEDGPLVLLLHGFPELWYGWRRQIPALAEAGFRVWAPDERGYNLSDRPQAVRAYHPDRLIEDVEDLIDAAGADRAHVVGHDWGGFVAWWMGMNRPERVDHLVVMNVPHPSVFQRFLLKDKDQRKRSSYIAFFQLPILPERAVSRGTASILRRTSKPGSFTDEDLARYREAWRQPGAARGMLNWYRALRYRPRPRQARIPVPTLLVWGVEDHALKVEMAAPSVGYCDDGRLALVEGATHWVHHDAAGEVNRLLLEHFGQRPALRAAG